MGNQDAGQNPRKESQRNTSRKRRSEQGQNSQPSQKPRTEFSEEQLRILRSAFEDDITLTEERTASIALEANLEPEPVKGWFSRERRKCIEEAFQKILADAMSDLAAEDLTEQAIAEVGQQQYKIMRNMIMVLIRMYISKQYKIPDKKLMPHILAFLGKSASEELVLFIFDCISRKFSKKSSMPSDDVNIVHNSKHPFLNQLSQKGKFLLQSVFTGADEQSTIAGAAAILTAKIQHFREQVKELELNFSLLYAQKDLYKHTSSDDSDGFRKRALEQLSNLNAETEAVKKQRYTLQVIIHSIDPKCELQNTRQNLLQATGQSTKIITDVLKLRKALQGDSPAK